MTKAYSRSDITVPTSEAQASIPPILLRNGKVSINEKCCCDCGCFLPYTTTVTFSNLVNKTHSAHCHLNITSNFGSGASAIGMSPGGCSTNEESTCGPSNRGPLTSVLLLNGGSGYALPGRREPVLTIKGSGKDAVFTPNLSIDNTELCPTWSIDSINVTGGTGYHNNETLNIKTDGITITPAVAILKTGRSAPTISASVAGGHDAVLDVNLTSAGTPPTWSVSSISVTNAGDGYTNGTSVTFTVAAGDNIIANASANIVVNTQQPEVSYVLTNEDDPPGEGAVFSWSLSPIGNKWGINVTIVNGGSGYFSGGFLEFNPVGPGGGLYVYELIVDGNGTIIGLNLVFQDPFDGGPGPIASVNVINGGSYWHDNGIPESVVINIPGKYYTEDKNLPPCKANITVTACGGGNGAVIEAQVDEDANSATFGQIIGFNIVNGGDNYLVWHWVCTQHSLLNNKPFVLRANNPKKLINLELKSCFGSGAAAVVDNKGPRTQPTLRITAPCSSTASSPLACYEITYTLKEHTEEDRDCAPYWSIDSIEASGGEDCDDGLAAGIDPGNAPEGCGTILEEQASITLHADNGALTGGTINSGGKYYRQIEWDGQPSPIYSVSLTNHGSGYAKLGRKEPSLHLEPLPNIGSGADFGFDLIQHFDKCNIPYWIIKNLTIDGGNGYIDGSLIVAVPDNPNVVIEKQIVARIFTREKPTITASIVDDNGSGASINIALSEQIKLNKRVWVISSVSGGGGKNYSNNAHVVLDFGIATQEIAAEFNLIIKKGKIVCVQIINGGVYYIDNYIPKSIELYDSGIFYEQDKNLNPYVANVEVIINQAKGSDGNGAIINAVVDDDTSSATFGQIKKLLLASCGYNYSYFGGPIDCSYSGGCQGVCSVVFPSITVAMPNNKNKPMNIGLIDNNIYIGFRSDDIVDCNNPFPSTANLLYGAPAGTATISSGGLWDSTGTDDCPSCDCPVFDALPMETPVPQDPIPPQYKCDSDNTNKFCISASITDPIGNVHNVSMGVAGNFAGGSTNVVVDPIGGIQYGVSVTCTNSILSINGTAGTLYRPDICPTNWSGGTFVNVGCECEGWAGSYSFELSPDDGADHTECPYSSMGTVTVTIANGPC